MPDRQWPNIGQTIADQYIVGLIEPRLAPADRITLADRLAAARADAESGRAALATARAALDRAHTLNADDKNVSDRAVQEAEAKVAAEQARLTAATESARLIESSLRSTHDTATALELERGGQVVEVLVHPGESVESGQPILRVARFDQLLARVDVPAGDTVAPTLAGASIVPLGQEDHLIRAERVALAAAVDPKTQGQPFLFRVPDPSATLRPGLSITAYLEIPGATRRGVVVPPSAVVRQSGKAWIYVQTAGEQFARRQVVLEEPVAEGWFTRSLSPGDRIVTTGAQTLLSEEFKSQIHVGEESQQ
jgi:biotin carboxyl carrier protein